jgi:hypothetical protein
MGGRDLEDLSGKKFVRKIPDSPASLLHPLFIHHRHLLKDGIAISTSRTGRLITIVLLEKFEKAIQLPVIHLDEFTHFQVKDLLQFGDLHDVHMFGFDEIFEMEGSESSLSREGEEIQDVSIVTAVLIGPHMLEKEGGPFETLCDFEMLVTDLFIMGDIFRPYPGRFQELYRVGQFAIKAEIAGILEIAVIFFLSLPGGMAIMIDMLVIVGTLPEADVVDDQFEIALEGLSDRFQGFEFPVDMFINDDLLDSHIFILEGFSDRIDTGRGRDLHLQTGKAFSYQIDEIGDAHRDRIGSRPINPFQKLDKLSISLLGILEVSKTRGIQEVTELQPSFMAGLDILLHIVSVHLGKDKSGSRASHHIEGQFAEEGIDGCPF